MPREAIRAAVAGITGITTLVALHSVGKISLTVAVAGGTVIGLVAAARIGWCRLMGSMHVPGSVLARTLVDPSNFSITDANANTWLMSDGERIHHFTVGHGPDIAIVIHGGPGAAPRAPWPGLADDADLTSRFTFHFYHQRGCGLSSREIQTYPSGSGIPAKVSALNRAYGLTRHVEDLEAIRRHLTLNDPHRKVHLVGHSFGGFLAALYVAELDLPGQRLASVMCIAPANVLTMPNAGGGILEYIRAELKNSPVLRQSMLPRYEANVKKLTAPDWAMPEHEVAIINAEFAEFYQAAAVQRSPQTAAALAEMSQWSHDPPGYPIMSMYVSMGMYHDYVPAIREAAARAPFPAFVAHCQNDLQPAEATREYVTAFGKATTKFQIISDVCHFPQYEAPGKFIATVVKPWLLQRTA
jgi:pimeloyl-ACP methyl ester carboxylesterase